eukprot:220383-Alexandrium_andersonii.AAC.1
MPSTHAPTLSSFQPHYPKRLASPRNDVLPAQLFQGIPGIPTEVKSIVSYSCVGACYSYMCPTASLA